MMMGSMQMWSDPLLANPQELCLRMVFEQASKIAPAPDESLGDGETEKPPLRQQSN
jgi:hypothetical protein